MSGDFPRVQIVNKDGAFDGEEHGSGHDFHGEIQWIYGEKNVQQTNNYLLDLGLPPKRQNEAEGESGEGLF